MPFLRAQEALSQTISARLIGGSRLVVRCDAMLSRGLWRNPSWITVYSRLCQDTTEQAENGVSACGLDNLEYSVTTYYEKRKQFPGVFFDSSDTSNR